MNRNSILSKITKKDLVEYLDLVAKYTEVKPDTMQLALQLIRTHKESSGGGVVHLYFNDMKRWYDSVDAGKPDYSVYESNSFLADLWACWAVYSRQYLKSISSPKSLVDRSVVDDMANVKSVVDLGCGFGYSTAGLKELFPTATIYGTNLQESWQYKVAQELGEIYDFRVMPDVSKVGAVDLVFASEYFEHIENSIDHLEEVLSVCVPEYLIIANAFNATAIGHFPFYLYNGNRYDNKTTNRMFNKFLREKGYEKVKTNCWNGRPSYWKRK